MRGGSPALLLAGGAVVVTLYNRGVWHAAWASLFGPDVPILAGNPAANLDNSVVAPGSGSAGDSSGGTGGVSDSALRNAWNTVANSNSPGGTRDWIDWCLAGVRRVRTIITGHDPGGVYASSTAQIACNASRLNPGLAPLGANVCFNNNHIGISNGNGTYTSVGIQHGGPTTLPYANNPAYIGWFA